jgi:hypothetical protein
VAIIVTVVFLLVTRLNRQASCRGAQRGHRCRHCGGLSGAAIVTVLEFQHPYQQ